jgi:hypothetical protein
MTLLLVFVMTCCLGWSFQEHDSLGLALTSICIVTHATMLGIPDKRLCHILNFLCLSKKHKETFVTNNQNQQALPAKRMQATLICL